MDGINTTLNQGGNGGGGGSTPAQLAVSTTYAALKALRDGGNLVPGTWYRITDYACTTTQQDTQSANHAFDIIVRADDESHLNENAFAAHHDGDTYFADCKLEAWQLKYCLDNDTDRFAWADTTNGTGVVYWMKDEWENECPYDFKNIQFSRTLTDGAYDDKGTAAYVYTFNAYSGGTNSDATVLAATIANIRCESNTLNMCQGYSSGTYKMMLCNNVFLNVYTNNSGFNCLSNTLGFECTNNTFGNGCGNNTFGNNCQDNTFGNGCKSNTFGNYCGENTFGNSCSGNTFGNYFQNNTFGNSCSGNTFGNNCGNNTFGNECSNNTFGNNCQDNTFGNYCIYFTVFEGVQGCSVTTGSESHPLRYCQILNGVYGGKDPTEIQFAPDTEYTQIAAMDSSGNLRIWSPGDLVK